jgi:hypothetical protein
MEYFPIFLAPTPFFGKNVLARNYCSTQQNVLARLKAGKFSIFSVEKRALLCN